MATTTVSKESLCNRALALLKAESSISNLITDPGTEAILVRKFYDDAWDSVLLMHNWKPATVRSSALALSGTSPSFGYTYYHSLPNNPYCLKIMKHGVVDAGGSEVSDWALEQDRLIASDSDVIMIKYLARIEDPIKMSPNFRTAFVYYLASLIAEPLMHSTDVVLRMENDFFKALRKAIKTDGQQKTPRREELSDYGWQNARFNS